MPLLDDIERDREVIRVSRRFQSGRANAVNGVINIITKTARESKGGSLTAGAGTVERAFGQARFGGKIADGIDYRAYVGSQDTVASPTGAGQNAHDGWADLQGGFRIDGATRNGGWQLEGDLYRKPRGRRKDSVTCPPRKMGTREASRNEDFTGTSSSLAFEWRRRLTESSDLSVTTSFDFVDRPEGGLPEVETHIGNFGSAIVPVCPREASPGIGRPRRSYHFPEKDFQYGNPRL